ncbi:helix-turn-helix domain-containing protein [Paenibacillus agricola]|uniref:Helix-turn-helix transcriptional regulator n=1 Tax=Paenibacillus agricola TaxID=2716264 RepID=A0ABX0J4W4_9BACL|nr:helix-turn-helix transcriptional regulator [Paenibacillus agricola]NHN31355.1 helix-turn-helix transcriptional regulator [Paenibacillus agricola]
MGQAIPEFGKFLESLRGSMSLREAAKKSGLSHAYIRDLELEKNRSTNEKITPSPDTLQKLSNAYGYLYRDMMIKAGHLVEQDFSSPTTAFDIDIDLTQIYYIEIGMKEIMYGDQKSKLTKNVDSLKDFIQFLDTLEDHGFKKVDSEMYVNFHHIRKYDERSGRLYFDTAGTGVSVALSALRQRKHHNLILRKIANNIQSSLEYSYGALPNSAVPGFELM